ncbi:MAG: hypothetical protein JSV22_01355 [Bacteroidales bacterium]|nr:MAG: hypothetical protein JSV22_01355 [Bacteroidales bacterium]
MKRKEFLKSCGSCGAFSLIGLFYSEKVNAEAISLKKDDEHSEPMNKKQVRQLLKFIDSSINESDKEKIFNKLGTECLYSRNYDKWVISFRENQEEFFNRVKRGESRYWEKLEYNKEKSVITLVGRKFQSCVCEYGQCDSPPESLCNYCCKRFQEEMFGLLLEKNVNVRIDESIILGGERCSTTIYVGE